MALSATTLDLLRNLARKPGHDEVKAYFLELLIQEFGAERSALRFEKRQPEICGRLDALIGRTVLEAKRDLDRELSDVLRRMPHYLADCEREHGEPFVGIASDGKRWIVYEMIGGTLVTLKETTLDPDQGEAFLAWLDGVVALKGSLAPDGLTIRAELGPDSIAFKRVDRDLRALWDELAEVPAEALKRQLWADMLKLVYGKDVEDQSLWFRHSYLVIVTKCIALAVMDLREDDPRRMLSGEAFTSAGITGAVESDFFDWMVATPAGEALVTKIMAHVRRFRLREVESDVLKILYESLIDASERHGLGEYYTPDWLAAKVVRHAVDRPLEQNVLDPACGSGTFLFHAVRLVLAEAEEAGIEPSEWAAEAAQRVTGMDIHPVAVIIARVTYLLALAPALARRRGGLGVPVYLGDAMQLGTAQTLTDKRLEIRVPPPPAGAEPLGSSPGVEILSFPETVCRDPLLFDKVVERLRTASLQNLNLEQVESSLEAIIERHLRERPMTQIELASGKPPERMTEEHFRAIKDLGVTYLLFDRLRREGRDTIWAYVARNLSRPLSLASGNGWAHVLVGNPPWVAYQHMSSELQKRFKELAKEEGIFVGAKFATHNDLCALFAIRSTHLYLKPAGRVALVLPQAVLSRGQYTKLRSGDAKSVKVRWDRAWTMDVKVGEKRIGMFPVPSCALFGSKRGTAAKTPEQVTSFSGWLSLRDANEELADQALVVEQCPAPQEAIFKGGSPFRKLFRQGATLTPRMLSLVERLGSGKLGPDPTAPLVRGLKSKHQPWRDLVGIENRVESDFLRPVLLGESILPFRIYKIFEAVIPIDVDHTILDAKMSRRPGREFNELSEWMQKAEALWEENAANDKLSLSERWNYNRGLQNQFPLSKLRVVYAKSGSLLAASIVRIDRSVIDHALYWMAPGSDGEAYFLVSILNSEALRVAVEKYQSKGDFGARHFDKVMWNLPIPRFDPKVKLHRDLAAAGAEAEAAAKLVELVDREKFQRARKRVRDALIGNGIAAKIETLVEKLLDGG